MPTIQSLILAIEMVEETLDQLNLCLMELRGTGESYRLLRSPSITCHYWSETRADTQVSYVHSMYLWFSSIAYSHADQHHISQHSLVGSMFGIPNHLPGPLVSRAIAAFPETITVPWDISKSSVRHPFACLFDLPVPQYVLQSDSG
jgi:hypothetical protein